MKRVNIALVGDYSPDVIAHEAIPKALGIAGKAIDCLVDFQWIGTEELKENIHQKLEKFNGIWCVPASPYKNMNGALEAIRFARENKRAFLGTCGGYQHAILEFTRNVLGFKEADNTETNPVTPFPLISSLVCAMVEMDGHISLSEHSAVSKIYQTRSITEKYHCSYGFNTKYLDLFDKSDLNITGYGPDGEPRIFELTGLPFFIGTAFQPERSALLGNSHPLITAFVQAAVEVSAIQIEGNATLDSV